MARERARHEERASAEKAKAEDTAREAGSGFRRDDAAGDGERAGRVRNGDQERWELERGESDRE